MRKTNVGKVHVVSSSGRDTLIFLERWRVKDEISDADVSYGQTEIGDVGSLASPSIFPHLAQFGGIRPPDRKRSRHALSLVEREEISRGRVAKRSLRSIAESLNRSPPTISRELRRNGRRQTYRAARWDQRAWDCATPLRKTLQYQTPAEKFEACVAATG